jgi:hypothetical protein
LLGNDLAKKRNTVSLLKTRSNRKAIRVGNFKQYIMKNILMTFFLLITVFGFSQSKIYTITEQYSGMGVTTLDKIIVTDPTGLTKTYDIVHFLKDPIKHDSEFNKILNEIVSKGYELLNIGPSSHGDMISGKSIFTRTWFLKQK